MRERNNENANIPKSNLILGLLVVLGGVMLLLHKLDIYIFPYWLLSWPMIPIVIGLVIGVKSQFKNIGWLILVSIGFFFLLQDTLNLFWRFRELALPVGIIMVGLFLLFRTVILPPSKTKYRNPWAPENNEAEGKSGIGSGDDYIDSLNIFGGCKKRIYSKSFRGGEVANFFGGLDVDLTQADVNTSAKLDVTQMFGGTKLIIPANWAIKSNVISIFGGVSDKRNFPTVTEEPTKTIILTGVCIFAGVEIKSY